MASPGVYVFKRTMAAAHKSRPNFYDAETLLLFRICDMRIGSASAIRINLVQPATAK